MNRPLLSLNRSRVCSFNSRISQIIPILLFVFLVLSILPIILLGRYSHPASDDFSYGTYTAIALREGHSLLGAVLYTIKRYYFGWQGTFSAAAAMALVPCIWGERLYFLTPIVMLGSISIGTFKLLNTILRKYLGCSRLYVLGFGSALLFLSIGYLPSPIESFFWWNGAVYYTFTYGVMLLFIERMLSLCLSETRKKSITVVAIILAIYLGGNNFVSALLSTELCAVFLMYCIFKRRDLLPQAVSIFLILLISFLISALAPGNAVRQNNLSGFPPIKAICYAAKQSAEDLINFSTVPLILSLLLAVPFLWRTAKESKFSFQYPFLVQVFLFLLFASQNTPHFFAAATAGPGRLRNIVYFSFLWFLSISLFYWCGYFQKRHNVNLPARVRKSAAFILGVLLICSLMYSYCNHTNTFSEAILELKNGSAVQFDSEQDSRVEVYLDPNISDVRLPPLTIHPKLLFWADLSSDVDDWANIAMSNYYGKKTICLDNHDLSN